MKKLHEGLVREGVTSYVLTYTKIVTFNFAKSFICLNCQKLTVDLFDLLVSIFEEMYTCSHFFTLSCHGVFLFRARHLGMIIILA